MKPYEMHTEVHYRLHPQRAHSTILWTENVWFLKFPLRNLIKDKNYLPDRWTDYNVMIDDLRNLEMLWCWKEI